MCFFYMVRMLFSSDCTTMLGRLIHQMVSFALSTQFDKAQIFQNTKKIICPFEAVERGPNTITNRVPNGILDCFDLLIELFFPSDFYYNKFKQWNERLCSDKFTPEIKRLADGKMCCSRAVAAHLQRRYLFGLFCNVRLSGYQSPTVYSNHW